MDKLRYYWCSIIVYRKRVRLAAVFKANKLGLGINAEYDQELQNLIYIVENIADVQKVSIGHTVICDAV